MVVLTHADCGLHVPPPGHPERPARLEAVLEGARQAGLSPLHCDVREEEALEAVAWLHDPQLAERLAAACRQAPTFFDSPDNPVSQGTYRAAVAAVGCALAGLQAIRQERALRVFAALRPPGHHATRSRAMGFCFFNNVAVAAEAACRAGLGPVAVVDFDVHHGNGTQELFYHRDDVFYLSVHRYPFYPGTGSAQEIGVGRGKGFTRNFPLAAGASDSTFLEALTVGLEELIKTVTPRLWLVSAGFDAHQWDPLGGMEVTTEGFGRIGLLLHKAAGEAPVLAVLEGGYSLQALTQAVRAFCQGLGGKGLKEAM